ncbi:MarR family winged helix-turn-helix transcriptional regulator [Mucilaginibacter sp. OK268]|uniref:MarR family winged helix-turn-helix transcriptional regulator n=1 Tax=Mucilaginibacter sp. OK268 TaxID=1881048 RepID=UPI002100C38C|nr:helix-turn-helix domain-containing protein [Mucilaginibacter sp. OK268]
MFEKIELLEMQGNQIVVQQVRAFNRFYTDMIGLLDKHLLHSEYSLAEARIIYEVYIGKSVQASHIMTVMHIDKSYLSRLLKKLEKGRLIMKKPAAHDARAILISLTEIGLTEFGTLNQASDQQIVGLIKNLDPGKQQELVLHMQSIMNILKK